MTWLKDLASTNFRIFSTVVTGVLVVIGSFVLMAMGIEIQEVALGLILAFLAAQGGWDYAQFAKKRETYTPAPPAAPDVEDATAAAIPNRPPAMDQGEG